MDVRWKCDECRYDNFHRVTGGVSHRLVCKACGTLNMVETDSVGIVLRDEGGIADITKTKRGANPTSIGDQFVAEDRKSNIEGVDGGREKI